MTTCYITEFLQTYPRVALRNVETGKFVCHRSKQYDHMECNYQPSNPLNAFKTTRELFEPKHCTNIKKINAWHARLYQNEKNDSAESSSMSTATPTNVAKVDSKSVAHTGSRIELFSFRSIKSGGYWSAKEANGFVTVGYVR